MKVKLICATLVLSMYGAIAHAEDPCASVACMSGKAGIAGGSAAGKCQEPIAAFFSILVFRHGKFKPGSTNQKRREYLESCPGSS